MQLIVNGEESAFNGEISVANLIEELNLDIEKIAIERNLEIVPASQFNNTILLDGDKLEIVHFIGGG